MVVSQSGGGRIPLLRTRLACMLAVAFVSTVAGARDLPPVDALALTMRPPTATSSPAAGAAAPARDAGMRYRTHVEPRLGLPTFLFASDRSPALHGSLLVTADTVRVARDYLRSLAHEYRISAEEIEQLQVVDERRLGNGAALVQFAHRVHGIEVFRERATVLVGVDGRLVSIGGHVSGAGGIARVSPAQAFRRSAADALAVALADHVAPDQARTTALLAAGNRHGYELFTLAPGAARLTEPARVKPVWFRLPGGLVPAHYVEVLVDDGDHAVGYSYVVSARDGSVLFRHNLESHSHTYRLYGEPSPPYLPYGGPQGHGGAPHPTALADGYQPPWVAPNLLTLANAPFSRNDPWLPPGATETVGNNVDAFANLVPPDGYNPPGDFRADVTAPGTFDYVYDPLLPANASTDQIKAAVVNLFYVTNWLHNWFYDAGFDEAAGNAQHDNYGRGGLDNDRMRAQAQDYSGTNNANMLTPADGSSPRMRMYVFTGNSASELQATGAVAGSFATGVAAFGPTNFDLTAPLIYPVDSGGASPNDGCEPLVTNVVGRIALINRGTCTFVVKAQNAQNAGAVGVIIGDNAPGLAPPGLGGTDPSVTIPVLSVTLVTADALRTGLGQGAVDVRLRRAAGVSRDGTMDNPIIVHEWGHYISNRLVMNSAGLTSNHARGMGEGWSDFHALMVLMKEEDALVGANANWSGVYTVGGYTAGGPSFAANPNNGFYYGIRRYPYSTNFAKNPLLYRHIANGVPLPTNPAPAFGQNGANNAAVHSTGEVWASMLLECYASLLRDSGRLSFDEAQRRMREYLVAGYKLTPAAPTFVEARDAILSAMYSQDRDDFRLCGSAFARRGLGGGATGPSDRFGSTNAGITESFVFGFAAEVASVELAEGAAYCDADGIVDSGESGVVTVSVRNSGFSTLAGTQVTLSSPTPGVIIEQPTVALGATEPFASRSVSVPIRLAGLTAPTPIQIDVSVTDPELGAPVEFSRTFGTHLDELRETSRVDGFESRRLAWTTSVESPVTTPNPAHAWVRAEMDALDHLAFGPNPDSPMVTWMTSPELQVSTTEPFSFSFVTRFLFESDASLDYDGGVIEISTDGGATWSDIGAAATPGYNGTLATGGNNPLEGRPAYVDRNASFPGYDVISVDLGSAYAGQTVQVRFGIAADVFFGAYGWEIDDIAFSGIDNTPFDEVVPHAGRCDLLTAISGTPQTTPVSTPFAAALQIELTDADGAPRVGVPVTFSAPAGGASARFGGDDSVTVVTDVDGIAVSPVPTANALVGSYAVVARAGLQTAGFSLANSVGSAAGSAPTLAATSDSGVSSSDGITNAQPLEFVGTCTDGDIVGLNVDGTGAGPLVVCQGAAYSVLLSLDEGTHAISASFTRNGVAGPATDAVEVTVDRTALPPHIDSVSRGAEAGTLDVAGSGAEAGAAVQVFADGETFCSAVASAGGDWQCSGTATGDHTLVLTAVQTDVAGNVSDPSDGVPAFVGDRVFADGFEG